MTLRYAAGLAAISARRVAPGGVDAQPARRSMGSNALSRIPLLEPPHQLFLPHGRAAGLHRQQFGAAEEEVAVDVPGEAHAAVRLDVFLGAEIVGVGSRGA